MNFFSTQIHHASKKVPPSLILKIKKECHSFRSLDSVGQKWSLKNYWGGYTSYGSISDLPYRSPTFEALKKIIDREALKYARSLEWNLEGKDLEMAGCWINIMGTGCHHSFHLHPQSVISGSFYVDVPKGSGEFKIEDPRIACFQNTPPLIENAKNQRYVKLFPKSGDILLFESWLKHEVPANTSKKERISISFNYQ